MADRGRIKPLEGTAAFANGSSARPPVAGSVARGQLREDDGFQGGRVGTAYVTRLPVPLTRELLQHGRERFEAFCAPCHDRTGSGEGMVVRRGLRRPPSYHIDRLREAPLGYFVDVISRGFGAMPDYAAQVPAADRWAIAAYIRALQLSQHARVTDLSEAERRRLEAQKP
jgi:mono/diheme cytochrome c family protein